MRFRQLKYFLQIADSGSLSKASELLNVAQPSLSQQLKALEDELGVELFVRHDRGVTPTEHGRLLAEHARTILQQVDRTRELLASRASNPVGRVFLGLPTSACRGLVVPLITATKERYPDVTLHVVEAMSGSLGEWIQNGRLDVALLYDHKVLDMASSTDVMSEDLLLIVPRRSPYAKRRSIEFSALGSIPLVMPGRPHVIRVVAEQTAARCHVDLDIVIDCDSLPGMIKLVLDGYATIFPHFGVSDEIERGDVVAVPIVKPTPSWGLSIVLSKRTEHLVAAKAFAGLMAEVIRDQVANRRWRGRVL